MYEPVADNSVTTIIKPKYTNNMTFDDEFKSNELVPPEKPPRKNKINKKIKQESNEETKNSIMKSENGEVAIDVEHIHIEANNFKNKFKNASVQTSPLIPYRLRFWPKMSRDVKCDPSETKCCTKVRLTCCCRVVSQWVLSQVGLTVVVILWALLGAFAFYSTEDAKYIHWNCGCSCKAGLGGKCKHIVAVLLAINRLRYVESLYEHAKSAPYIEILQEEDTTICLQQCCVQTYNSLFPCEAKEVCQRTFTDKEAWGQERQYRVTASRCYSLFTYSLSEWEGKSEKYFFGQTFENEATRYGISQEKLAKEAYSRQKGDEVVEFGFCVCQTQPWMGVSPDGIIFLGGKPKKLLEIKCPVAGPRELTQSENIAQLQNKLSEKLANELRQSRGKEQDWKSIIDEYLRRHQISLLDAVSAGFGEGGGGSIWTYPGCILFAVSLLTTLGFGAPVPRTSLGRGAAVLFSAIGIPLHFLLVLNVGNLAATKLQRAATGTTDVPTARPCWLRWFPVAAIAAYYLAGVLLFGLARQRSPLDSLLFPLDFTAAGGVAATGGHVRILYALYLEVAVTLAAVVLSLTQASATRGVVDVGLRLGLLTNT